MGEAQCGYSRPRFLPASRKQSIDDATLWRAIANADRGLVDADLGGGVIKQRAARVGRGKRSGYRTIVLYRTAERALFVYGFAKNEQDNIEDADLKDYRQLADEGGAGGQGARHRRMDRDNRSRGERR